MLDEATPHATSGRTESTLENRGVVRAATTKKNAARCQTMSACTLGAYSSAVDRERSVAEPQHPRATVRREVRVRETKSR